MYLKQPGEGFPNLKLSQILRVKQNFVGLAVAPRIWWKKFSDSLLKLEATESTGPAAGQVLCFQQSVFDPALFFCHDASQTLRAVVAVHVDDLLIAVRDDTPNLKKGILELFPFGDLKSERFEYCGKAIETIFDAEGAVSEIKITQTTFTEGRLDP